MYFYLLMNKDFIIIIIIIIIINKHLPFFPENQTHVCSVRAAIMCLRWYSHSFVYKTTFRIWTTIYKASTKQTLRKSTVLVFLYCFEKSLESF